MDFTPYGEKLAAAEPVPPPDPLGGATAHLRACQYDASLTVLLTGKDINGKRFTHSAKSVYGARAMAHAAWGIRRAWHVRADGTRKLIFRR